MEYQQQQQSHRFMRPPPPPPPPPPSAADPYQRPPPQWTYSNNNTQQQFQYQSQHSPSPHYPAHQPSPYPAQHPPPQHHLPPRPPQSYPQDWGSGSWSHHQSWEYPTNNNEEDWAAKARAWAAAKSATDNQHPPPQFAPAGRPEGQNHFHDQYSQPIDPQYHTPLPPASSYQPYPVGTGPPNRSGAGHSQESHYISSEQASYATGVHAPYAARDGSLTRDSTASFPQHERSSISPLVHQQEVPSSYSSVAGNGAGDRYEKFNGSSGLPVTPGLHHHVQPLSSSGGRSGWMEEHHHLHGSQPAEAVADLSDQPLNFAPQFNRDLDPHSQPNYTHSTGDPLRGDPVGVSPNYSWGPFSAPGAVYPPGPPKILSEQQIDHSIPMPPPPSGHSSALFPTGPGFQPSVPMIGASFGVGPGITPHPIAFSGDAYGVSSVSERPKKASVPNWLREEIIKNKSVITSSAPELPKEDYEPVEEDINDMKGGQADRRSIDSSRSTEDENEDEEEVEAARTAAINQEIKRVLTEVLLKVTDELFDEIATKVLKEDDLSVEVGNDISLSNHQVLPPAQAVLTPKASAKILIPTKGQEVESHNASEKSSSGSAGDILGLGNYASDEEDDGDQSAGKLKESPAYLQSSSSKDLVDHSVTLRGIYKESTNEPSDVPLRLETDGTGSKSPVIAADSSAANAELSDTKAATLLVPSDNQRSSKRSASSSEEELQNGSDRSKSMKSVSKRAERPGGNSEAIMLGHDENRIRNVGNRSDKHDRHESKGHKNSESAKERVDRKGNEENRRHEERHSRDETKYHNGSKDKGKDKGKTGEKTKDSESRKRSSPSDDKERTSQRGRDRREDTDEKSKDKTKDEKKERSRRKNGSDSSRHKRRRSSSIGARGRQSKDNPVNSPANGYSDESSDDSKRKSHHSKRRKSPSPSRPSKRQVSRSPHSKHSKRRHSPYSSLETTRGNRSSSRSRSRSPVRRRR